MSGPTLRVQAILRVVGAAAVLVVALVVLFGLARVKYDPWWLVFFFIAAPIAVIFAGVPWMLFGGGQGASVEVRRGQDYFIATNINVLGRPLARAALDIYGRSPVPRASGAIGAGSPADPRNIIEAPAELPAEVTVTDTPIPMPNGAGELP